MYLNIEVIVSIVSQTLQLSAENNKGRDIHQAKHVRNF